MAPDPVRRKTDPQIVRELLRAAGDPAADDPAVIADVCERYVGHLEEELARAPGDTRLMPGVPDLLDRLESRGDIVLGLLTGNVARGAGLKLRAGGLDPARFLVGAYGSDSAHRPDLPAIAAGGPRLSSAGRRAAPRSSSSVTRPPT